MRYKTLLVHLADPARGQRLLEAAVPLARACEAHLVGLSVIPPYMVVPAMEGAGASVTIDEHRTAYKQDMRRLAELFRAATAGQSFASEWREADAGFDTVTSVVLEHGRAADLVITAQQDTRWAHSRLQEDPVRLTLEVGRPVLLVPNVGEFRLPAERITVAWNGRREAARAAFDALPLLQSASAVDVLWVNPEKELQRAGDLPGTELCLALARHGVKCEASRTTATGDDAGSELLRRAAAFGSGLLVMGCYGHSRLRELILGGASRRVLQAMRLPVLMSH